MLVTSRLLVMLFPSLVLLGCAAEVGDTGAEPDGDVTEPTDTADGKTDLGYVFRPRRMEDRTAGLRPLLGPEDLHVVADLPYPPGNVAVSEGERLFFSYHPDGNRGAVKVAELVDGEPVPYPSRAFQDRLHTVLSVRVDRHGRLWMLDHGHHGVHAPRLIAVDLASDEVVLEYTFARAVGFPGSMFNDFQVSPDGQFVFIADTSILVQMPAIVVVDLRGDVPRARRRLHRHESLRNGDYNVYVEGERLYAKRLPVKFGVDGIALDQRGEWLYYASLNSGELHRVRARHLTSETLSDAALADRVQHFASITMTDGMTTDAAGNIYLSDMEHSAIARVGPDGRLDVVLKDERLRWPDGFSWSPGGHLYVTASALHQYLHHIALRQGHIDEHAPYQIFRLDPQATCPGSEPCWGPPGH